MKLLKLSILYCSFNQFVMIPLSSLPILTKGQPALRLGVETFPSFSEVLYQTIFCLLLEDFGFYWGHRFLHWEPIYPYIHKIHHLHKNTIGLSTETVHPIEFVIANVLPANLGFLILQSRAHLFTQCFFIILRIIKASEAHSGYQFSWSPFSFLPFFIKSEFHNYHHLSFKEILGSFLTIWDSMCNTINPKFLKLKEQQSKIE